MRRDIGIAAAVVTIVFGSLAVENEIMANEGGETSASSIEADTPFGSKSLGGPFSLEIHNATLREVSGGGIFRLVGSTQLKAAGDEVFADGFEIGDTSLWSNVVGEIHLPSGAIAFFELEECPEGWADIYGWYRGRAIVGLMPGGQLRGQVDSQSNGQSGFHYHDIAYSPTTDSDSHNHRWAYLVGAPVLEWRSYTAAGNDVTLFEWSNGINNAGSGFFLFAPTPQQSFYTENKSHDHIVGYSTVLGGQRDPASNVQLRICKKQ